nr:MAG TPA: hypothetical protein [Caudoviricetes sp.]
MKQKIKTETKKAERYLRSSPFTLIRHSVYSRTTCNSHSYQNFTPSSPICLISSNDFSFSEIKSVTFYPFSYCYERLKKL